MPQPDDIFQASIVIACEGSEEGRVRTCPAGIRRSRDGAKLDHVVADARYWAEQFCGSKSHKRRVILLQNPSRAEVVDAISEAGDHLNHYKGAPEWGGGQINFVFAGHGTETGELVLDDACLSSEEIATVIAEHTSFSEQRRLRLAVVFDSCFSGKTLVQLMLHPLHGAHFLLIDGFAAALPNESAWELEALKHGALTFTMRNRGNAHVDQRRLARAVEERDDEYLRLALQAFVPNPVSYLTEGDQHSIDLINGHVLEVKGCGTVDVVGQPTVDQLVEAIESIRSHPDLHKIIEL